MKKFLVILFSILFCLALLAGCGKKESFEQESSAGAQTLVGTWKTDPWESGYIFREDGTGTDLFWKQDFTYSTNTDTLLIVYNEGLWAEKEYYYLITGNTLTLSEIPEAPEGETVPLEIMTAEDGSAVFEGETRTYSKTDETD